MISDHLYQAELSLRIASSEAHLTVRTDPSLAEIRKAIQHVEQAIKIILETSA